MAEDKAVGSHFLSNPQIFENRNFLRNPHLSDVLRDKEIVLPSEPVIWVSNHGFKDDGLATILAAKRHAYILFGSLAQFYNTADGITAFLNGVAMFNRKVAASRQSAIPKAVRVIQHSADLIVFPEGVWNKTPNKLLIDLWPGIYRIACETGAKIVPVAHYIRDVIATWFYLMIEVYGKTTRKALVEGTKNPIKVWENQLIESTKVVARYDKEIELNAAYYPKWKVDPKEVWRAVADI